MEAKSSSSSDSKICCYKAAEYSCSACLFCISCPFCIVWSCIKLPCKVGLKAAKHARDHCTRCCGSEKKVYASYSSFSDIDTDGPSSMVRDLDGSSGSRTRQRDGGSQSRRRSAQSSK